MSEKQKLITVELDGGSFENPAYVHHKRGKNWAAILTGKNAANMQRQFLKSHGATVDIDGLPVGTVLEVGGDYITSGGNRQPDRRYWRIIELTDEQMTVENHPSAAKALKAARVAAVEAITEEREAA